MVNEHFLSAPYSSTIPEVVPFSSHGWCAVRLSESRYLSLPPSSRGLRGKTSPSPRVNMFTHVAHHQQSNHFSNSLQYPNQDLYKYPPFIPPPNVAHNQRHSATQTGNYHRRLQKPQQYAYPLQSSVSLSRQQSYANGRPSKPEASEHMLRRKTPNGTLAAGYDGRPVEWATRPHAVKHFLMPVSRAIGETTYHPRTADWPDGYASPPDDQNLSARDKGQRRPPGHGDAMESLCPEPTISVVDCRDNFPLAMGLDSVLNQGSLPHQCGNMAGDQPLPTVLQPMWPPYVGPTSLNDPGPYGPYWPNGAFVPHRPTPLRDTRYPNEIREAPIVGASHVRSMANNRGERNDPLDRSSYPYDVPQQPSNSEGSFGFPQNYLAMEVENSDPSKIFPCTQGACMPQYTQTPIVHRGKQHSSGGASTLSNSSWRRSYGTGAFDRSIMSQPALQKQNFHASQAQFKDKAWEWAYNAYYGLISSIRRNASTGHHIDRKLRATIYPRPPRQSSSNPSGNYVSVVQKNEKLQNRMGRAQENLDTLTEHDQQWLAFPNYRNNFIDDYSVSNQSSLLSPSRQNRHFRQPWQPNEPQSPSPYPTPPSIPNIQSLSVVPPSISYQYGNSPSGDAASALEMLERLCQESGWEWTEGMLLGGCLAYGLGEHTNAMNWYLKVLSCDPK